jgi:hypothetical protein
MGILRRIFYATCVTKEIREAAKIDELKKQNALLQEMAKKNEK